MTRTTDPHPGRTDRLAFGLFLLGLALLLYVGGMVAGKFKLPPYELLDEAHDALVALKDKHWVPEEPFALNTEREQGGVVTWDKARASPGLTLLTAYRDGSFGGSLVDMEGRTVHRWEASFGEVWPEAPHVRDRAPDRMVNWHGAYLFPNGDLLLNFQGGNFPLGGGLVRLDRHSRVVWALPRNTHHDMDVLADGTIVVPAHAWREEGVPECERLLEPPYYEDQILLVSPEGKVRAEHSILRAVCRAHRSLFSLTGAESGAWRGRLRAEDPLHLNGVDVVRPEQMGWTPVARAGDLLLSLRNLNTVGFFDPDSGRFRWLMVGPFVRQHDADLMPDGGILVFDNRGGGAKTERSRVLAIDPVTQAIRWRFEGSADDPLWSEKMGNQQHLPNGNVLVTESWGGRVLEVTGTPEAAVVWEYVNLLPPKGERREVGLISEARRFRPEELPFLAERPVASSEAGPGLQRGVR